MPHLLDQFWQYSQSDNPSPILDVSVNSTKSIEFEQLAKLKLVRSTTERHIVCPGCFQHSEDVETVNLPEGLKKFFVFCPQAGTEESTPDDMRQWRIHFSELPAMMSALLGMREPQTVFPDALWKMGRYGNAGDIWFGRWLHWPEAKDWLSRMPKTTQTILLYIGQPPDLNLLTDIPQSNVIDAADIFTVDAAGLHVDMSLVDAALRCAVGSVGSSAYEFRRIGDQWQLSFAGHAIPHRDLRGMTYIHYLIERAPKLVPALELRRAAEPDYQPTILGSAGEVLDEQALRKYHQRLAELHLEDDDAQYVNDFGRMQAIQEEQAALEDALNSGVGLGGRKRKASDDLERNRKAVSKAITTAIQIITDAHPDLGHHLRTHITCGDHCFYRQEPGIIWST